jgi:hypothetical protein
VPASDRHRRSVVLRDEHGGRDHRHLDASIQDSGDLVLEGQDLGPSTGVVSGDGEYEWVVTVRARHLPALKELLNIAPTDDVLAALEAQWAGPRSYEREAALRSGAVPCETHVL